MAFWATDFAARSLFHQESDGQISSSYDPGANEDLRNVVDLNFFPLDGGSNFLFTLCPESSSLNYREGVEIENCSPYISNPDNPMRNAPKYT